MPYKLLNICDTCGREEEIPMSTFGQLKQQTAVFAIRCAAAEEAGYMDDGPVVLQCGECGKKPLLENMIRISGRGIVEDNRDKRKPQ